MKFLILGGTGMLGHRLFDSLKDRYEVRVTLRKGRDAYHKFQQFSPDNAFFNIDVRNFESVAAAIAAFNPEAVINCAGITNKGRAARDSILNIEVNSLFPHRLARLCEEQKRRLIHLSTDCVFTGKKGGYRESDPGDARDLYGRTKFLGEVGGTGIVTLRTSMIGLELTDKHGLIEWFLCQKGPLKGYRNAIYSGFTTHELSRIIETILLAGKEVPSPLQVSSDPISKYDLLSMIQAELDMKIDIIPDMGFKCDRSLDSSLFQREFGYTPTAWSVMIKELCEQIKSERL